MSQTTNVIDITSQLERRKLTPVAIGFGDEVFQFEPVIDFVALQDKDTAIDWYFGWLSDHLVERTREELHDALVKLSRERGMQLGDVLHVMVNAYIKAAREQVAAAVEAAAERPTKPRSGSGRSTTRGARKSAAGSSLVPVGR